MRVLFLLTQSLDYPSGLGRYWPLARHMVKLGYEVEIAALHPLWARLKELKFVRDGVRISYVAQMHVYHKPGDDNQRYYYDSRQLLAVIAQATAALTKAALHSQADVIHIAKAQPMNGIAGWLASKLRQHRLFLDCDDDEAASNRFGSELQRSIVLGWEKRLTRAAQGITVNTSYLRERSIRWGTRVDRIRIVPNGFDPDRFQPVAQQVIDAVRHQWELTDRRVVLYLGSLSFANHPILLLLDAFVQVHRAISSSVLLIVGSGEDYARISTAIRERGLEQAVIMTGRIAPDQVNGIYAASDVVVDPVFDDAAAKARSPLKIVESLASGVPVVTGDVGDRPVMLDGGKAGVLVAPGDAQALAAGIVSVFKDRAYRESLSNRGRDISQRYRWDRLVHEFAKVYEI